MVLRPATGLFMVLFLLSGCSAVPDWVNPMAWYKNAIEVFSSGDKTESVKAYKKRITPKTTAQKKVKPEKTFPNLASVPKRPDRTRRRVIKPEVQGLSSKKAGKSFSQARLREDGSLAVPPPPPPPPTIGRVKPSSTLSLSADKQVKTEKKAVDRTKFNAVAKTPKIKQPSIAKLGNANKRVQIQQSEVNRVVKIRSLTNRPTPSARSVARIGNPVFGAPPEDIVASLSSGTPPAFQGVMSSPETTLGRSVGMKDVGAYGGRQEGVIMFNAGSSLISRSDRRLIGKIAKAYKKRGGAIRVDGHASSRTRDMDLFRHHMVNFNISLSRANAVAKELVRNGVPQNAVFVTAMSDSKPIWAEVMPKGDAGNQRVEVFFTN
tara:strand:- start:116 stop:1246 length:1131 start_codon:yes stop_codon:yes gene_type:complete